MDHFWCLLVTATAMWLVCGIANAQSNPALERGTAAAATAVAEGLARIDQEASLLERRLAIQRDISKGKALVPEGEAQNEAELPPNIAEYLRWSTEQAAIKLWPTDEEFGVIYGTFRDQFGVGSLGFVPFVEVVQIIDENSARVNLKWYMPERWKAVGPAGGSWYQLGDRTIENVILREISTRGMVDEGEYKLSRVFEIAATERCTTTSGGSKTVFVVRPFDIEPYRAVFEAAARAKEAVEARNQVEKEKRAAELEKASQAKKDEGRRRQLTRVWTDSTGGFSVTGLLIDVLPGPKAIIKRDDGNVVEVPFYKLSKDDRTWILNEGKALLLQEGN